MRGIPAQSLNLTCEPTQTPDEVDIPALREKYRRERDKRLRKEGSQQYVELSHEFAAFYETDPHSPAVIRDPVTEDIDVAVLGGGFAGLLSSACLKRAGVKDVRIIEMGGDFGGVWYWNRYPGISCDNDAYCYLPLLEEVGFLPSKKFADGVEIYEHCRRIGKHFGLYEGALFGTQVRSLRWDEPLERWRIATNHGDDIRARFVVMAAGSFNKPKLPGIPGIKTFKGHSFHTSRWDYEYTGGGPADSSLSKLADKRIAIIGTGASAIQAVPFLGRDAKHLYVFQRTPSPVDQRPNPGTDPEWAKSLQPGWQKQRQANFHAWAFEAFPAGPFQQDLVCDFWTEVNRNMADKLAAMGNPQLSIEELLTLREQEDYKVMERIRCRVANIVKDAKTAEALKPYYRFLCKRPTSNELYLATFNRPNVTLVDVSDSKGVERLTEKGVVADGVEYEVDCIIYASGFEITTEISRRFGIEKIEGRGGVSLFDYWSDGFKTLHGMTSRGFPNQFFTGFTQAGVGANVSAMYEQQAEHIAYIIKEGLLRGARTVEPSQEAQDAWIKTIRDTAVPSGQFLQECTPGYYNNEGGGSEGLRSVFGEPYGPGFYAFGKLIEQWREQGELRGLVIS
jgi:cyclohexanone monooxygenase